MKCCTDSKFCSERIPIGNGDNRKSQTRHFSFDLPAIWHSFPLCFRKHILENIFHICIVRFVVFILHNENYSSDLHEI